MSTPTKQWNLDQLKHELSARTQVKSWILSQEHTRRRERYFMTDGTASLVTDQDRETRSQSIQARVFVHLNKPGRQGEISKKLFPALPLGPQLDAAIASALQTDHQAWDLPTHGPAKVPQVASADPRMAEDLDSVVTQMTERMTAAVSKKRATKFNSAELFLSVHDHETHLSNGFTHRYSQSRVYAEAAYSMTKNGQSDEYLNTAWSVNIDDLNVEKLFDETSDRAEHSLDVVKPQTGKYPVIVDSEVLATLFNGHLSQLGAGNLYNRLPFVKPGDPLIEGATGDLLSITLDPSLPYGADAVGVSEAGVAQQPLPLVDKNKVVSTSANQQFGSYLGIPVTTSRGDVVVEGGTLDHGGLTQVGPLVVEILQFSGLFADSASGTFSSEIRLAKLYDNVKGTVTYLKGGSLSGSISENFKGLRLSKERVKRAHFSSGSPVGQGYYGPEYALLSDVSIVG